MSALVGVALASAASLAAVSSSLARYRRVREATRLDVSAVLAVLGRRPSREALEACVAELAAAGEEAVAALLEDALRAAPPTVRAARVNEHLSDFELTLAWGESIPAAAVRLAALGAVLGLAVRVIGDPTPGGDVLGLALVGAAGAAASAWLGRLAAARAAEARRALDALVERCVLAAAPPSAGVDQTGDAV